MIHPIIDQYYNQNPTYVRSSGFAVSKGLVGDVGDGNGEKIVEEMGK